MRGFPLQDEGPGMNELFHDLQIEQEERRAMSGTTLKENTMAHTEWRHKKRGGTYRLVGIAEVQAPEGAPLTDYEVVQVYVSEDDGKMWVRRKSEFFDGRFEPIHRP